VPGGAVGARPGRPALVVAPRRPRAVVVAAVAVGLEALRLWPCLGSFLAGPCTPELEE
jgi:hypothetical protein